MLKCNVINGNKSAGICVYTYILYAVDATEVVCVNPSDGGSVSTAAYCLLLPGITLRFKCSTLK